MNVTTTGFWGTVGAVVRTVGNTVIEKSKEAKEIQQNEMASKTNEELLAMREEFRRSKKVTLKSMALISELKKRGLN